MYRAIRILHLCFISRSYLCLRHSNLLSHPTNHEAELPPNFLHHPLTEHSLGLVDILSSQALYLLTDHAASNRLEVMRP